MKTFFLLLSLLGVTVLFSQTAHTQSKCNEPIRKVIWKTLDKDILSGPWDCRKALEAQNISLGKLKAVLVRGYGVPFCGATGNCSTWLLSRRNNKWRMILNAGSVIEYFEIKPRPSTKTPDLLFRGRMGAGDSYMGLYRFNGVKYTLQSCKYEVYDINRKRSVRRVSRQYCSN